MLDSIILSSWIKDLFSAKYRLRHVPLSEAHLSEKLAPVDVQVGVGTCFSSQSQGVQICFT